MTYFEYHQPNEMALFACTASVLSTKIARTGEDEGEADNRQTRELACRYRRSYTHTHARARVGGRRIDVIGTGSRKSKRVANDMVATATQQRRRRRRMELFRLFGRVTLVVQIATNRRDCPPTMTSGWRVSARTLANGALLRGNSH